MKFFATLLAIVPIVAALPDNVDIFNKLAKRTACSESSFLAGITRIELSVSRLSVAIATYGTNSPPCTSVNIVAIFSTISSLTTEINSDASTIGACSNKLSTCSHLQSAVTATLIPKVSALSSVLVARRKIICCNSLTGVVKGEASIISSAVLSYGSSIRAKLTGTCSAAASSDISKIESYINGIIATAGAPC